MVAEVVNVDVVAEVVNVEWGGGVGVEEVCDGG